MKVVNTVKVYEVDGQDAPMIDPPLVVVESHWNRSEFVTLHIDGKRMTVLAKHMRAAIDNATNTARW